jgi:hypothetical protein
MKSKIEVAMQTRPIARYVSDDLVMVFTFYTAD